jgi:hypothetical protein
METRTEETEKGGFATRIQKSTFLCQIFSELFD